ncbi:hypothetical protein TRV_04158 [Trichophyton verrucosum HKI 0517]|uniref:guanylate kinase n=1 Tax=Trichophyton verrucosum (strain HKI 0517) TaxID=663202 RepID=D4DAL1_TRIVH|nr:uncharacterized protein TRV_04158 [Trichophyton verrucosum HKI 0517]EFE41110.1 hypothetical protein TRV_04158 [Trichophyton verrucosum HKI 0517]
MSHGKFMLVSQVMIKSYPDTFAFTVSHTTRGPRPGEVEGVAYYFTKDDAFSALVSQDGFVEYATFNGHRYGTSKQTISGLAEKGLIAVLDIDIQGVKQLKAASSIDARYVFIVPPSLECLEARLRRRGTEAEEDIQHRLAQSTIELSYADIPGFFDKVIVNDELDKAYDELVQFVHGS